MKLGLVFATVAICFATLTSSAQQNPRTLKDENRRIRQGVKSGELTAKETAQLKRQEAKLRAEKARLSADGNLSKRDKAKLLRDEKKLDRNIRRQKHDRQDRN